jgi:hypothetical protein
MWNEASAILTARRGKNDGMTSSALLAYKNLVFFLTCYGTTRPTLGWGPRKIIITTSQSIGRPCAHPAIQQNSISQLTVHITMVLETWVYVCWV